MTPHIQNGTANNRRPMWSGSRLLRSSWDKSEGFTNRQDKSMGILKVGDVAFHRSQALGSCWCRCLGAVCVLVSTVRWNRRNEAKAGTPSESCATNRVGSFRRNRALREM